MKPGVYDLSVDARALTALHADAPRLRLTLSPAGASGLQIELKPTP